MSLLRYSYRNSRFRRIRHPTVRTRRPSSGRWRACRPAEEGHSVAHRHRRQSSTAPRRCSYRNSRFRRIRHPTVRTRRPRTGRWWVCTRAEEEARHSPVHRCRCHSSTSRHRHRHHSSRCRRSHLVASHTHDPKRGTSRAHNRRSPSMPGSRPRARRPVKTTLPTRSADR